LRKSYSILCSAIRQPKDHGDIILLAEYLITKEIEAVYEHGIIRPLQPLELPEGSRLDVIVITHEPTKANGNVAETLAEIADLPLEGETDTFFDRDHLQL
jgi:predicted DNA-binding antitoxin AbrB/MazE fold protein